MEIYGHPYRCTTPQFRTTLLNAYLELWVVFEAAVPAEETGWPYRCQSRSRGDESRDARRQQGYR